MKSITFLLVLLFAINYILALNPSRTYSTKPDEYGLRYEEVIIKTKDNMQLKGWFYNAPGESKKIIILSDDGDGNMADLIELASNFVSLGYNVLTYDYRGFGESSDFNINPKFYIYAQFEKDLTAAITYVRKHHSKLKQVDLYGLGIGAGLSISVGSNRSGINKIIADSPYSTLEKTYEKIITEKYKELLLP